MQDLDKKISEFQEIETFGDNAVIPVVQGNPLDNYKITPDNFINSLIESIKDALNLSNVVGESHTHHNKEVLDAITQEMLNKINNGLWELVTEDSEGNPLEEPYILTKYSAVSEKELSAYGAGDGLGSNTEGTGYTRLDDWFTYDADKAGWVLSAKLGKDLLDKNSVLSTELSDIYNELRIKDSEIATDLENKYNELKDKDGDKNYETAVNMPSKVWEINHNLNKYPSVTVINNDNQVVIGDVMYIDKNSLTVSFSAEFTGKVICN